MKIRIFAAWLLVLMLSLTSVVPCMADEAAEAAATPSDSWWGTWNFLSSPSADIIYGGLSEWWHNSGDMVIFPDNILVNDQYFGRVVNDGGTLWFGDSQGISIGEQLAYWLDTLSNTTGYYSPLCNIIEIAYGNYDFTDTEIVITRSELYAWGYGDDGALIYDEYYIFRITRNGIDWEDICVRFYSETDGGESIEARLYANSPHGGWAHYNDYTVETTPQESYDCIYMGDMYVAYCDDWTILREEMDVTSMQVKKVPLGALVHDCYSYGNGFTFCEYDGTWGYILTDYLSYDYIPANSGNDHYGSAWIDINSAYKFLASETYEVETLTYGATSYLTDSHGIYDAGNAFDGNPGTAWSEGMTGHGHGQELWCTWEVIQGQWWVQGVALRNGYQKSDHIYNKNSRVCNAEIWIGGEHFNVELYDYDDWQYIMLPYPIYIDGSIDVSLVIESVYIGDKYTDTCISEMDIILSPTDSIDY